MKSKLDHTQESFDALIDLLLKSGNEIDGTRWSCSKEGFHTQFKRPIDWSLVYASFEIDPNSVMVYEDSIATYCGVYHVAGRMIR
ncbi:hypothetical protein SAMN05518865_12060 [Duganella sp. CF458]|uniref:hypothetical protein n=1 Tax=Duganella sp. CF458 TaxID=1884368 RepID=UPI0008E6AEDA|nr:hypothetical protein [Duganella sp. CF458]SFG85124.1 hypothetical protein SAMN05518865_12060 [Duganella sp. CF458]